MLIRDWLHVVSSIHIPKATREGSPPGVRAEAWRAKAPSALSASLTPTLMPLTAAQEQCLTPPSASPLSTYHLQFIGAKGIAAPGLLEPKWGHPPISLSESRLEMVQVSLLIHLTFASPMIRAELHPSLLKKRKMHPLGAADLPPPPALLQHKYVEARQMLCRVMGCAS